MKDERPTKRKKLFEDDDTCNVESEVELTVNKEYAARFEHNKRREELQRLEEADLSGETDSSTDSEDEDEDGYLASGPLDDQFQATLQAIRNKDPSIYDKNHCFYPDIEDGNHTQSETREKPKPMYLRDYHRKNLLKGNLEDEGYLGTSDPPQTYDEEQQQLRKTVIQEIHDAAKPANGEPHLGGGDSGSDDEFLTVKKRPSGKQETKLPRAGQSTQSKPNDAKNDVDAFLDEYIKTKAWIIPPGSKLQPFESEDEEEDAKADAYEEAYNFRFEDPQRSNEILLTHARDSAARYSARNSNPSRRKRAREAQKSKREALKENRSADKARLRQLKIYEMEGKLQKIKEAAGLRDEILDRPQWTGLLEEAWDNDDWEREMNRKFDQAYYADRDEEVSLSLEKKSRPRKPKWEDDIEIDDLVPGFHEHEDPQQPHSTLSDEDDTKEHERTSNTDLDDGTNALTKQKLGPRDRKQRKVEKKTEARKERRHIEKIVDERLHNNDLLENAASKRSGQFRYRETSPTAFGLTPTDILMASDSQLNQYVGLKKLAAFRTREQKNKDKRRLGKKARLREWRKEAFGLSQFDVGSEQRIDLRISTISQSQ